MLIRNVLLTIAVFIIHTSTVFGQADSSVFASSLKPVLQERLYVHTDKHFYVCGEILWFKVYLLNHQHNSAASKVAYLELINDQGKAVSQVKIEVADGNGDGNILLSPELSSGHYLLQAYTKWMSNYGEEVFFKKKLTIINTRDQLVPAKAADSSISVRIFPEGGSLISGISNKVGFSFKDGQETGMDIKGYLIADQKDTVLTCQPFIDGSGSFSFIPQAGKKYALSVKSNGKACTTFFPEIKTKGYMIRLQETTDTVSVIIHSHNMAAATVRLLVQSGGRVRKIRKGSMSGDGVLPFSFAKKGLGNGVIYFTVCNDQQRTLCERGFFISGHPLKIMLQTDNTRYAKRQPVHLKISTKHAGIPAVANMSVSVYKVDELQTPDSLDISSYSLLTAELSGNIASPWRYLGKDSISRQAADVLMLTHSINWYKDTFHVIKNPPELNGLIITGKIRNRITGKPAPDVEVYLSVTGRVPAFYVANSDKEGNIGFELRDTYGKVQLVFQTNPTDTVSQISMDDFFTTIKTSFNDKSALTMADTSYLHQRHLQIQLLNEYFGRNMIKEKPQLKDSTAFYGKPDEVDLLDDFTRFPTMEEVFRESIPAVMVRKRKEGLTLLVLNKRMGHFFDAPPLTLIDGVPEFDQHKIFSINPLHIKKVETVACKYFYNSIVANGIVSLSTYNGDLNGYSLAPNALVVDFDGLQLKRGFYSPLYDTAEKANSRIPDYRNLLYWQPTVQTTDLGTAAVDFYTPDIPGRYFINVQGITEDNSGSAGMFFEVED